MNYRRIIPNSISALSLTFGVLSIFDTFEGNFSRAAIFIILAVIADSMDGRAARFLGVGGGEFGKELDSLCDLGSFGVAPAILIYQYGRFRFTWKTHCFHFYNLWCYAFSKI